MQKKMETVLNHSGGNARHKTEQQQKLYMESMDEKEKNTKK